LTLFPPNWQSGNGDAASHRCSGEPQVAVRCDAEQLPGNGLAIMPINPQSTSEVGRADILRSIEMVVFPAVQMLDVTGPLQVFATANDIAVEAGGAPPYTLRVVARGGRSVTASAGLGLVTHELSPADAALDTLMIAGGQGVQAASADAALVEWVRARSATARRTASVCTGVNAGLNP
jgi:putative intracellular protease/amidase